jgi:DUF177 domain-containing protein
MSAQAVIDSLEFARTGQTLQGSLAIPELKRLKESLADDHGQIDFAVKGARDGRRRPVLTLEISGNLHLQCQRCLGLLEYPLQLSNTLLLVGAGEVAAGDLDDEDAEWIEASGELDVALLVEDEIILSLPYAPRHAEGACGHGGLTASGNPADAAFAKLAALRRNSH